MTEIRIEHAHAPEEIQRRLVEVAQRHDIALHPDEGGHSGRLEKKVMLMGAVRATYEIEVDHLCVEITEAPAAIAGTIQRLLEDELGRALA